jgi:hypothetical protein
MTLRYGYSSINAVVLERNLESGGTVYVHWLDGDAENGVVRSALPGIMRVFCSFVKSIRLGGAFEARRAPDVQLWYNYRQT